MFECWCQKESLRRAKFTANLLGNYNGKILDIGAYKGELSKFLSDVEYYPLDLYDLRRKFKNAIVQDLNKDKKLHFKSNFFDYVVCIGTLEHLFYPEEIMKEIKRVLKPKRIAILSFPNDVSFYMKILHLFNDLDIPFEKLKFMHHWFFGINSIRKLVSKHFKVLKEKGYVGLYGRILLPQWLLDRFPETSPELFYKCLNEKR